MTFKMAVERIAIETSHPEWLIQRWIELYGEEEATAMAHENNNPPAMTITSEYGKSDNRRSDCFT